MSEGPVNSGFRPIKLINEISFLIFLINLNVKIDFSFYGDLPVSGEAAVTLNLLVTP